jgi:hypothetical protein
VIQPLRLGAYVPCRDHERFGCVTAVAVPWEVVVWPDKKDLARFA